MAEENGNAPEVEEEELNKAPQDGGESGNDAGAAATPDYATLMEAIRQVQENQADMRAQIKKITDAQSVMVESGAVVHELQANQMCDTDIIDNDGFISLDKMDLSI